MKTSRLLTISLCLAVAAVLAGCEKDQPQSNGVQNGTTETVRHEHSTSVDVNEPQADAGTEQTICPVMGGKINKEIFTEYQGKKVYFCCPACKPEFEKNPEKYISKLPQFQNAEK